MTSQSISAPQSPVEPVRRKRFQLTRSKRRTMWFYIFQTPWLLGLLFLTLIPVLGGLFISFTNYDGLNVNSFKMVGFRNYARILNDGQAIDAFWRTIVWVLVNVPITLVFAFIMALLLNQSFKGQGLFRTIYFLPTLIPVVAVTWIFKIFLAQNNGPLNAFISVFRPDTAILWVGQQNALSTMVTVSVWMSFGTGMVIFLAGLQGIPRSLEEAALIDGANVFQSFRHVTIPLMTPVIFFQLILSLIFSFQELIRPLLLWTSAAGGANLLGATPSKPVYFAMVHVYRQVFINTRFGYGIALLWMMFIFLMGLALLLFWSTRFWVYYEEDVEGK